MTSEERLKNTSNLRYGCEADDDSEVRIDAWGKDVEAIFESLKDNKDDSTISVESFVQALTSQGLIVSEDVRLTPIKNFVDCMNEKNLKEKKPQGICLETFICVIDSCGSKDLLMRALNKNLVIPDFTKFGSTIEILYEIGKTNTEGSVAGYIAELRKQDPEWWAVSVCTVDGQILNFGHYDQPFTLQSTVKPFMYSLCLEMLGKDVVHKYIGQEPSNQDFNAITLDKKGRPYNPMVNAGAIIVCSLLLTLSMAEKTSSEKFNCIFNFLKTVCGDGFVQFNNAVFISEKETASRNRAIAYFMKAHNCFPRDCDVLKSLDFYFQSCSIEVKTSSLATMGATLANGGVCPVDGRRVLSPDNVRCVLSLMQTCGMYNLSGEFAYSIGIPGKAGVSGSVCLVVPGLLGVGMFSPRINDFCCSNRAYQFCQGLMKIFAFHPFDDLSLYRKNAQSKIIDADKGDSCPGHRNALTGDVATLASLVEGGYKTCSRDEFGRTALHVAATAGHFQCVQYLVRTCVQLVTKKDCMGQTALDDAIHFGHTEIIDYLENWAALCNRKATSGGPTKKRLSLG